MQHNNGGGEDCHVTTGPVAEPDETHQFVSLVDWPSGLQLIFLPSTSAMAAAAIAQDGLEDGQQYVCTVKLEREVLKRVKSRFSIQSLSSPDPKAFAVFVVGAAGDAELRFLEITNWEAASVRESLKTTNALYGVPLTAKQIAEVKRIIDSREPGIILLPRAQGHIRADKSGQPDSKRTAPLTRKGPRREISEVVCRGASIGQATPGTHPTEGPSAKKIEEIVGDLLVSKQKDGLSRRYIESLRSHLVRFAAAFQTDINLITAPQIEAWLRGRNIGPRARNNIRGSIITLFHFARKHGHLPKGQPTEADDIAKARDRGGHIGILRPAELASILSQAPERVRLFLAIGAFTGMRSSEILRLHWKEVDFESSYITVSPEKTKTATRRLVPMQPNLIRWLTSYHNQNRAVFKTPRDARRAIAFAKSCGVEWPNNALRHSYAAYRLAVTADAARVALEMGSSPEKVMTNYREFVGEKEGQEWFGILPDQPATIISVARSGSSN